jgi:hypothetical protein
MAAKSVTHSITLSVGDISLVFSDTQTAASNPTNFIVGDQQVSGSSHEYLGRANKTDALGDLEMTGHNTMLLLRNDTASGGGELTVSFDDASAFPVQILPQQMNLYSVEDIRDVKLASTAGVATFTFMAIQLDS